ncbi:class I SAM-dependent methyltransferase [Micromonospora sp. NPDC000089]|uniref:class I SAM-dependent methyltransferase n=1 Tax=unclassified Micromonospora TaxID=2617518 RepID=UPI0036948B2C
MRNGEFLDPRLVEVYDVEFTWGRDDEYFLALVGETSSARVLDFGCGTGRLTLALAAAGHTVTGVDPAPASLAAARAKPGADRVDWRAGSAKVLDAGAYDVVVSTSHVTQFVVDEAQWERTLAAVRRALVPGGRLIFDSRDPTDRGWERWNRIDSLRRLTLPDGRAVQVWTEVTDVRDRVVSFTRHYRFPDGEVLADATMRFRTEGELRSALAAAGLRVRQIQGGFGGEPVGHGDGELLVVATAV